MKISFGNLYTGNSTNLQAMKKEFGLLHKNKSLYANPFFNSNSIFGKKDDSHATSRVASMVEQMMKEKTNNDIILRKIARGETLSEAEKEAAKKIDPIQLRKAENASRQRQELEKKLKSAKTEKEAKELIAEAKAAAVQAGAGPYGDHLYSSLMIEGINEAERKYFSGALKNNRAENAKTEVKISIDMKG